MSNEQPLDDHAASEVAIVGMAGRFPGAKNLGEFWRNLRDGVESVSFFTPEELRADGVEPEEFADPRYVPAKAVLEGAELFDAAFFDYNPREAEMLDPQLRLMLECAVEAFEDAGYDPEKLAGRASVFAGVSAGSYLTFNLASRPDLVERVGAYQVDIGNHSEFVPTTISFKLNLKGPSINVQTACSTSLVAVHAACQSLLNGESDVALAGGGSVTFPHRSGHLYQEEGIMSPDGHCRAFDERARGTVSGEGAALVVLKRLADALEDGDHIHAVIKGSAVNNDGSLKIGFTAPSVDGQAEVIAEALAMAGVDADSVTYVETHGTGTQLGDPIELAALTQAFRATTERRGFCAIGSLKSNIGHLDAGAGVAGLIKAVLALRHKEIPPSLHYERPNPKIDFEQSPFYVNARLAPWEAGETPRRAGVSSFGIGGTNAHVILEEAPPPPPAAGAARPWSLLVLSARSGAALDAATRNLAEHLRARPEANLADVAYTLQVGRREFAHRRALVARDAADAAAALEAQDPRRLVTSYREPGHRPNVFMFPGQGAQYAGMSRGLYESEPVFAEQVDALAEQLLPLLGLDLRGVLYPAPGGEEEAARLLGQTRVTQPALFVVEYALARLWMSWGVGPAAMIGHSVGEYVAACLAGVFTPEDALALVAARGRLMQGLPAGAMLAVALPEKEAAAILPRGLSVAAVNTPDSCVVSGPPESVEEFRAELLRRGTDAQPLRTSHAFHSEMMEPILAEFTELVRRAGPAAPKIPFISNVTGAWITAEEAADPRYWARHLRQPVRFARGVGELLREPGRILIEVGPGHTLSTFARRHPSKGAEQVVLNSMRHPREGHSDAEALLTALGKFWAAGGRVEWRRVGASGGQRRRTPLPTYPFERARYYVEPRPQAARPRRQAGGAAPPRKNPVAEWFYVPSWKRLALHGAECLRAGGGPKLKWLLLADERGLGSEVAARLVEAGDEVVTARAGARYEKAGGRAYTLDARRPEDYRALLGDLRAEGLTPDRVVHLWGVTGGAAPPAAEDGFERAQESGLYSLIFLTQALVGHEIEPRLFVVTDEAQEVADGDVLRPEKATVLAACRVIPQEHPGIGCRSVDVRLPPAGGEPRARLVSQLVAELTAEAADAVTAYRGRHRWVQTFEPVAPAPPAQAGTRLRERGVYMITGGLSGVGLVLAGYLAKAAKARLVLTGRAGLPGRDEWDARASAGGEDDELSRRVRRVRELEASGAEVLVLAADVSDEGQMRAALEEAERRFGPLDGVIHGAAANGPDVDQEITATTPEVCGRHFRVKPRGLLVLEKLLRGRRLDFRMTISSLSSILGGLSFTAYAASNIFVDALAQRRDREGEDEWTSVNWDGWDFDGADGGAAGAAEAGGTWILPHEGAEAFGRVLSLLPAPQVLVSTTDLRARLGGQAARTRAGDAGAEDAAEAAPELHARPELRSAYVAPENELEQEVAGVWQDLLGIRQVGVHDNFFDLGGHSLLATMVISRLRKSFGVELQLRDFFESPTVGGLSLVVAQRVIEQHEQQDVARLLEELPGGGLNTPSPV
ncbi:MAG TPA: SDR family oxidoreductase [Pyrinomonadaceae bacterium]|jgi:acyl transferase domain-containing protein/acyl carrier protein